MQTKDVEALVDKIHPLTDTILQVILSPETYVEYQAGQYLQILRAEEALSYSIANAPLGSHKYELHIRHIRDNAPSQDLLEDIRSQGRVSLRLPWGDCSLSRLDANRPIVFIAGGTGFAPVKAMIEQLLTQTDRRPFTLYWGARSKSDLYMDQQVLQWQAHVSHFQYESLLSGENKNALADLVKTRQAQEIQNKQYVIAGPFDLVYRIRDTLSLAGVAMEQMFSDAFAFERHDNSTI